MDEELGLRSSFFIYRKDNVLELWTYLLELLRARRLRLELSLKLQKIFQEMLYILDWMDEIKVIYAECIEKVYQFIFFYTSSSACFYDYGLSVAHKICNMWIFHAVFTLDRRVLFF